MGVAALVPGLEVWMEVIVAIVCALFAMLASAGGIGGGVIFVSMLQLFGVSPHVAAPLSKAMIFGGSCVLTCMNIFQHEDNEPTKPSIIWDLVFIIEPAAVSGALIGALINVVLPEWLLLVLEVAFLLYTTQKMLRSSLATLNKERIAAGKRLLCTRKSRAPALSIDERGSPHQPSTFIEDQSTRSGNTTSNEIQAYSTECSTEIAPLLDRQELTVKAEPQVQATTKKGRGRLGSCGVAHFKSISAVRMIMFILSTVLIMTCQVISQEFERCSTGYWIAFGVCFSISIITIIIIILSIKRSLRIYNQFMSASEHVHHFLNESSDTIFNRTDQAEEERDLQLSSIDQRVTPEDKEALHLEAIRCSKLLIGTDSLGAFHSILFYVKLVLAGLFAGILGAMLGIGGGLLKNPILISFGIDPERARTASTVMIAFTSMSSMISYVVIGGLHFEYAWPLMLTVGAFFVSGYYLSELIIRCFKTKSFIPFLITALIVVCTCFIVANMIIVFIDIAKTGHLPGFTSLC
ncbi:Sulfite exporter TauE/SafE [Giardia duodenalis]|uniref:Sulfite exporter TauE/SafE n=1 Tax=Giardia intestinalis (strain ATCC 50803 / WB clone C6) TaxID=184922 RepID=A8BDE1_GIAIC|nr:Sulfite exporter TauE/SafE [Giardia intestinalis]KAE8304225.1 Sulfite exporter TauE/SafE [Giardia intestinalis]|eukprot:XP_001707771.1 Hypothetical protein GL50803_4181 [Giardia lamblia ATCC 50803]